MTLDDYLRSLTGDDKMTDAAFGARVGLSQSQISRLRRRENRPSWPTMAAIERETGGQVTASAADWPEKMEAAE